MRKKYINQYDFIIIVYKRKFEPQPLPYLGFTSMCIYLFFWGSMCL